MFSLKPNQKVVFIGDSITDAGRQSKEAGCAPYGIGYVKIARDLLIARYPEYNLRIENRGIGGNTIRSLKARWQADVIAEKPDVLSIMIGINDVWRFVANRPADAVPLEEYEATYRELLKETQARTGARIILMDPYVIESNRADPFRARMDTYISCGQRLAREFGATSVRTMDAFDVALKAQPSSYWSQDRVHPDSPGHAVIALAFLRAIGFELA